MRQQAWQTRRCCWRTARRYARATLRRPSPSDTATRGIDFLRRHNARRRFSLRRDRVITDEPATLISMMACVKAHAFASFADARHMP